MVTHDRDNVNRNLKIDQNSANARLFPDVVDSRYITAVPDQQWHIDKTFCPVALKNRPESKHYIFVIIDPCTQRIVFSKASFSRTGRESTTINTNIRYVEQALMSNNIKNTLILHSDRASAFISQRWYDYINSHPLLEGSHTPGYAPNKNAVVERCHRTIKNRIYNKFQGKKKEVATTRGFDNLLQGCVSELNTELTREKNYGATPNEALLLLNKTNNPQITMARKSTMRKKSADQLEVEQYRRDVLESPEVEVMHDNQLQVERSTQLRRIEFNSNETLDLMNKVYTNTDVIRQRMEPKKKKKGKGVPLRDAISNSVFQSILKKEKPARVNKKSWGRFKIASTILFLGGMRVNEISQLSNEDIEKACENRQLRVFQSKVQKIRTVVIPESGVALLKKVHDKHKEDVFEKDDVLFPLPPSERPNGEKFIKLINKFLEPFATLHGLNLKSHSFRINYVTQVIRHKSIETAQFMIGHTDIRSTSKYNRFMQTPKERDDLLEKMFDLDENFIEK